MKAYLEAHEGTKRTFWEIAVDGETLTTTTGVVGAKKEPKQQSKTLKSPAAALQAAEKEVAKKKAAFYFDPSSIEGVLEAHIDALRVPAAADLDAARAALPHAPEDCFAVYRTGALSVGFFADFAPGAPRMEGPFGETTGLFLPCSASDQLDEAGTALDPWFYIVGFYPDGSAVVQYNQGRYAGRLGLIDQGPSDELLEHLGPDPDATVDAWLEHGLIEPVSDVRFSEWVLRALLHVKAAAVDRTKALQAAIAAVEAAVSGDRLAVVELDLSEKGLRTLPAFLGECQNLERLSLRENALTAVPEAIRGLTRLRSLDLYYNPIVGIPAWLSELPLTGLNLGITRVEALPPVVCELTALEELTLPTLNGLPAGIGALTALRVLDVSEVRGPIAEGGLARLHHLERLELGRIAAPLPSDLGELEALQILGFEVTPLNGFPLPASIARLKSLRVLQVGASTLTEAVGGLTALEELTVSGNAAGLPESLGSLSSLRKLDLRYARARALPASFRGLQALEYLNLESSSIAALPPGFGELTRLRFLALNTAHIDLTAREPLPPLDIGDALCGLEQLEHLALSVSALPSIRGSLRGLRKLTTLKVFSVTGDVLDPASLDFVGDLPALTTLGVPYENKAHFRQLYPGLTIS